jgi:ubiquinone/menaquinone biosynthesis C-methylase UbiE
MDARQQRLVQRRGWDRASDCYGRYWQRQLRPAHDLLVDMAALSPGNEVIDIACGSGEMTVRVAAAVSPGRVTATDLSPKMVDATRRLATSIEAMNIEASCRDASELGETGPFDAALCSLGLMYVPEPVVAIAEIHRVVRPGGRVAVSVWGDRERCGWAGVFGIIDARVVSDVCPRFFALGSAGVLTGLLERAGFDDIDEARIEVTLHYRDDDETLGAALLGGPVALAFGMFDSETRRQVSSEYLASVARFRNEDGTYDVPGEFVVAAGRRPD